MAPEFSSGFDLGRDASVSPGLSATDQRWAAMSRMAMARGTGAVSQAPTSVLQARSLSANGMSPEQAENRMLDGRPLSNINGMSPGTQEQYNLTRMVGGV
jgi:hypothetical protein